MNYLTMTAQLGETAGKIYERLSGLHTVSQVLQLCLHIFVAFLAVIIVVRCGRSLLRGKIEQEIWGFFCLPDGTQLDLIHWENTIGRAKGCDVVLNYPTVSRSHAAITRDDNGSWTLFPLSAKNPVYRNGEEITQATPLYEGDEVTLGGLAMSFFPSTPEEEQQQAARRTRPGKAISPTQTLVLVTLFQAIVAGELLFAMTEYRKVMLLSFALLCAAMWGMYFIYRAGRRTGYEVETLAFFLTTMSLEMTATKLPTTLMKQTATVLMGLVLFFVLALALRSLDLAKKLRWPMAGCAAALLAFNLLFGARLFGARNWVALGPIQFQPSEMVKIVFVIAGAATLDRLFSRRNLIGTIVFSAYCVGCLALMSDFGTALIFFVAFLVIAFLRTGDLPSVAMVTAAAGFACLIIVKYKPYIVRRFSVWRHVWEDPQNLGYQQTRTMSAMASGGLFGTGAGQGWLKKVAASTTDLVFGAISEELGLIVALCAVAAIVIFALFAIKSAAKARSSFYVICANAVAAMFVTQSMLNVFGSTDLLPLTGVTLPFVSTGGSSMMSCWALLAYIKAADTRQNSSFAVRVTHKRKKSRPVPPPPPEEDEEEEESWDVSRDRSIYDCTDEPTRVGRTPQQTFEISFEDDLDEDYNDYEDEDYDHEEEDP